MNIELTSDSMSTNEFRCSICKEIKNKHFESSHCDRCDRVVCQDCTTYEAHVQLPDYTNLDGRCLCTCCFDDISEGN